MYQAITKLSYIIPWYSILITNWSAFPHNTEPLRFLFLFLVTEANMIMDGF